MFPVRIGVWTVICLFVLCNAGDPAAQDSVGADDDPKTFIMGFDLDGDGRLSQEEYAAMLQSVNRQAEGDEGAEDEATAGMIDSTFRSHDVSGDGKLDYDEIVAMLMPKLEETTGACHAPADEGDESTGARDRTTDYNDIPAAFFDKSFDPPPDVVWGDDDDLGGQDVVEFAMGFDKNGDGVLSMGEFLIMMEEEGGDNDDELIQFFRQGDLDKDGKLNRPEIATLFYNPDFAADNSRPATHATGADLHDDSRTTRTAFGTEDPRGGGRGSRQLSQVDSRRLFQIVDQGDLGELEQALKVVYSADGGAQDQECTPLHVALHRFDVWNHNRHLEPKLGTNYTAAALMLMDYGADLRMECEGRTPLHFAVQHRNRPVASRILRELRARIDSEVLPEDALEWGAGPSDYAPNGGTALHAACYVHGIAIGVSKILVGHPGAGVAVVEAARAGAGARGDLEGAVAAGLHDAFAEWGVRVPRGILRSGGTTYARARLTEALSEWSAELVAELVAAGMAVDGRDLEGEAPLHVAAMSGDAASARELLRGGADWRARGNKGFSALERALQGGHTEVVELLLGAMPEEEAAAAREAAAADGWRRVLEEGEREESELRGTASAEAGARGGGCPVRAGGRGSATPGEGEGESGGGGGWRRGCRVELEVDYCDIAVVDAGAEDVHEVVAEHVGKQRPLLIKNAIREADWASMRVWSREGMREYGAESGREWKVFRQRGGTKASLSMRMEDYLAAMAQHDPERDPSPDWLVEYGLKAGDPLVDTHDVIVKRYFGDLYENGLGLSNYQFMVAPVFTGASPHFHFTSARLMVHGRARWFLWPVAQAFYSSRDIHDWYLTDYPSLSGAARPLECVQGPGDLMFVPPLWGHGVLYLEDTAGMASLFRE